MKLIGITGLAGSGKDTAAAHLNNIHGFTRMAFADPVKAAACAAFGLSYDQAWNPEFKNITIPYWDLTPRQIFQRMGTDAMQTTFGKSIWVKRLWQGYDLIRDTDNVVISDVRFELEAQMVKNEGGIIIEVRRGNGLNGDEGLHVSEAGIGMEPDFIIDNNGTLDGLHAKLDEIVERMA